MFSLPKTIFRPTYHVDTAEITKDLDGYFQVEWPFPSDKSRTKFLQAKLSLLCCLAFPHGQPYRVKLAGELAVILTLTDDLLEKVSYAAGAAIVDKLIAIGRGSSLCDSENPIERLHHAFCQRIRKEDPVMGVEICEAYYEFMRMASSPKRSRHASLKEYLDFREVDAGMKTLTSVSYFVQGLNPTVAQRAALAPIERTVSNHFVLLNDIVSWDRELKESLSGTEGSNLCSSVVVMAETLGLDHESTRTVLATACRELEKVFVRQRDELLARCAESEEPEMNEDVRRILGQMESRVAGSEQWHFETTRYQV